MLKHERLMCIMVEAREKISTEGGMRIGRIAGVPGCISVEVGRRENSLLQSLVRTLILRGRNHRSAFRADRHSNSCSVMCELIFLCLAFKSPSKSNHFLPENNTVQRTIKTRERRGKTPTIPTVAAYVRTSVSYAGYGSAAVRWSIHSIYYKTPQLIFTSRRYTTRGHISARQTTATVSSSHVQPPSAPFLTPASLKIHLFFSHSSAGLSRFRGSPMPHAFDVAKTTATIKQKKNKPATVAAAPPAFKPHTVTNVGVSSAPTVTPTVTAQNTATPIVETPRNG